MIDPARTAYVDQVSAGVRETDAAMHRMAAAGGGSIVAINAYPPWMVDMLDRADAIFAADRGEACAHWETSPYRLMVAWQPGAVVCGECLPALAPTDPVDEDRCDRCQEVHPDRVKPFAFRLVHPTFGAVLMLSIQCHRCHADSERSVRDQM